MPPKGRNPLKIAVTEWMRVALTAGLVTQDQHDDWEIVPADPASNIPYGVWFRDVRGKKLLLCAELGCDMSAARTVRQAVLLLNMSACAIEATMNVPRLLPWRYRTASALSAAALADPLVRELLVSALATELIEEQTAGIALRNATQEA